jgi:hypothetical protein
MLTMPSPRKAWFPRMLSRLLDLNVSSSIDYVKEVDGEATTSEAVEG